MRGSHLKDVRQRWNGCVRAAFGPVAAAARSCDGLYLSTGRVFFARNTVIAKALGTSDETEHKQGLSALSKVRRVRRGSQISRSRKQASVTRTAR